MALDTYANLQIAILNWLARPGDALVSPSVPDMITLFEAEARRRLFNRLGEATTTLATVAGTATVALPTLYAEARELVLQTSPVRVLTFVTPQQMDETQPDSSSRGAPVCFTIVGTNFRLSPTPDAIYSITCDYLKGVPALSDSATTNWLLTNDPDAYLFGSLAEAEAFIGDDERVPGWLSRRDASFASIGTADRKSRWSGSVLQIRTDTGNP